MNLTKKKTGLLVATLIAVFATGFALASVMLPPRYVYVTVEEAISISPESVSLTCYVGESGTANFTVHNAASVDIPLNVSVEVTSVPEGGNASDLTLSCPSQITATPGDTTLTIAFSFATGAVPGDYTVTVTVTRV